jgi:hypothetical protein
MIHPRPATNLLVILREAEDLLSVSVLALC